MNWKVSDKSGCVALELCKADTVAEDDKKGGTKQQHLMQCNYIFNMD